MKSLSVLACLLVLAAACGGESNNADVQKASCELLSAGERDEIKRNIAKGIEGSESLATWRAWWAKYASRPFPYDVTQPGYFEWTGSGWAITGTTFNTLVYRFEDGSVIEHTGNSMQSSADLTFPDGTVARSAQGEGDRGDINDRYSSFNFVDWSTSLRSYSSFSSGRKFTAEAPFGVLHADAEDQRDTIRLTLTWPGNTVTYDYESNFNPAINDEPTVSVRVNRNGATRSFSGRAVDCHQFSAAMKSLFPDLDELLQTGHLRSGN